MHPSKKTVFVCFFKKERENGFLLKPGADSLQTSRPKASNAPRTSSMAPSPPDLAHWPIKSSELRRRKEGNPGLRREQEHGMWQGQASRAEAAWGGRKGPREPANAGRMCTCHGVATAHAGDAALPLAEPQKS